MNRQLNSMYIDDVAEGKHRMLWKSKGGQREINLVLESQEYFLEQILWYVGSPGKLIKMQNLTPEFPICISTMFSDGADAAGLKNTLKTTVLED